VVPIYKGERSVGSHKLQISQLNLSDLLANGTRHSRIPVASLGHEYMDGSRATWNYTGIIVRKSVCQDIAEGAVIDAIIIDFSRTFDLILLIDC
jgi:hypothetical protein